MAHETSTGSSPIIRGLMNGLREVLPKDDQDKLDAYTEQAEASSPGETSTGRGTACTGPSRSPSNQSTRISPTWGFV